MKNLIINRDQSSKRYSYPMMSTKRQQKPQMKLIDLMNNKAEFKYDEKNLNPNILNHKKYYILNSNYNNTFLLTGTNICVSKDKNQKVKKEKTKSKSKEKDKKEIENSKKRHNTLSSIDKFIEEFYDKKGIKKESQFKQYERRCDLQDFISVKNKSIINKSNNTVLNNIFLPKIKVTDNKKNSSTSLNKENAISNTNRSVNYLKDYTSANQKVSNKISPCINNNFYSNSYTMNCITTNETTGNDIDYYTSMTTNNNNFNLINNSSCGKDNDLLRQNNNYLDYQKRRNYKIKLLSKELLMNKNDINDYLDKNERIVTSTREPFGPKKYIFNYYYNENNKDMKISTLEMLFIDKKINKYFNEIRKSFDNKFNKSQNQDDEFD